mmetsp:Transcript_102525/g.235220  ORF Transcript_102525/g.235220 Transcript_102525/m.235220 type:complete len:387 (-) Transcript_102525:611-1771(-)
MVTTAAPTVPPTPVPTMVIAPATAGAASPPVIASANPPTTQAPATFMRRLLDFFWRSESDSREELRIHRNASDPIHFSQWCRIDRGIPIFSNHRSTASRNLALNIGLLFLPRKENNRRSFRCSVRPNKIRTRRSRPTAYCSAVASGHNMLAIAASTPGALKTGTLSRSMSSALHSSSIAALRVVSTQCMISASSTNSQLSSRMRANAAVRLGRSPLGTLPRLRSRGTAIASLARVHMLWSSSQAAARAGPRETTIWVRLLRSSESLSIAARRSNVIVKVGSPCVASLCISMNSGPVSTRCPFTCVTSQPTSTPRASACRPSCTSLTRRSATFSPIIPDWNSRVTMFSGSPSPACIFLVTPPTSNKQATSAPPGPSISFPTTPLSES